MQIRPKFLFENETFRTLGAGKMAAEYIHLKKKKEEMEYSNKF